MIILVLMIVVLQALEVYLLHLLLLTILAEILLMKYIILEPLTQVFQEVDHMEMLNYRINAGNVSNSNSSFKQMVKVVLLTIEQMLLIQLMVL